MKMTPQALSDWHRKGELIGSLYLVIVVVRTVMRCLDANGIIEFTVPFHFSPLANKASETKVVQSDIGKYLLNTEGESMGNLTVAFVLV